MQHPFSLFVKRYLTRGAVGVSIGLAAVAAVSGTQSAQSSTSKEAMQQPFSERLQTVRSATSDVDAASTQSKDKPIIVAQFRNID